MNAEQFAYWLQGFVELNGQEPTADQWLSIKEHLKTVFVKVTPPVRLSGPNIASPALPEGPSPVRKWMEKYGPGPGIQITC